MNLFFSATYNLEAHTATQANLFFRNIQKNEHMHDMDNSTINIFLSLDA